MPDTKLTDLPTATTPDGSESAYVVQGGASRKILLSTMFAAAIASGGALASLDTVGAGEIDANSISITHIADSTDGSLWTFDATGAAVELAPGTAGQLLTTQGAGALPTWETATGGYTDEEAQDATGAMVNGSLTYTDATPLLSIASTDFGDITTSSAGTSWNIDASAVGATEIATDAVGSSEIAADAVTQSEIATDGVGASEIQAGSVGTTEIATNTVGDADLRQGGALSVIGRSANSTGNVGDISATAGQYGAMRERGSALSFRRESYQALTISSGTATFTVATSPNATLTHDDSATLVVNFVSPVNGEGGKLILTNPSAGENFDQPAFQLGGSTTNVRELGVGYCPLDDAITVYEWAYNGTLLYIWTESVTDPCPQ